MTTIETTKPLHSAATDPGRHADLLAELPGDPARLPEIVSGFVLHPWLAGQRDVTMTAEHDADRQSRSMTVLLDRLLARDDRPLTQRRAAKDRFFGTCRDYALVTCSILRHHGHNARIRCGFADYFTPDFLEDHWVAEVWSADGWRMVDAELDAVTIADMGTTFPADDVPRERFMTAPQAWRDVRSGKLDPDTMGVSFIGISGLWFAAASVCRDLASLYGVELLPWDYWDEPEQLMLDDGCLKNHLDRIDDLAEAMMAATAGASMPDKTDLWPTWLSWPQTLSSYTGGDPVRVDLND
ncbi:MAG: transglutaminase domain-containing protein [Pseudomonadota bacterium]